MYPDSIHRRVSALTALLPLLAACLLPMEPLAAPALTAPLSANDVSILLPVPRNRNDLARAIKMSDLMNRPDGAAARRIWSQEDFQAFISTAGSPAGAVGAIGGGKQPITLPATTKTADAWFIAGIRIDHAAPGNAPEIIHQLGQQPQIRLIAQPVTFGASGQATVHDIAAHLIFNFAQAQPQPPAEAGCLPRSAPDDAAFEKVVIQFAALRDRLAKGTFGGVKVTTAGKPLDIHPGFAGASGVPFTKGVKAALEQLLAPERLQAMAVMGLANGGPEPWVFLSMARLKAGTPLPGGGVLPKDSFLPAPAPALDGRATAQMLSFVDQPQVQPVPQTNNLNPTTCHHATFQAFPSTGRKGMATASLIDGSPSPEDIKQVTALIADPVRSHFFNTDCVSCHTETQLSFGKANGPSTLAVKPIPGIATNALPNHNWNVRNFGWFPNFFGGPVRPTITRRTANETAEVVAGVNAILARITAGKPVP